MTPLRRAMFIWAFVVAAAVVLPDHGNRWSKVALAGAAVAVVVVLPTLLWTRARQWRDHLPTA